MLSVKPKTSVLARRSALNRSKINNSKPRRNSIQHILSKNVALRKSLNDSPEITIGGGAVVR